MAKKSTDEKYDRFSSAAGVAKAGTKSPYAELSAKKMKKTKTDNSKAKRSK